ncbi:MAG: putative endonuclease 4 [Syntrophorhabdus sp. PtaU1.Bin050]|nr:MAG: putative endonuclease 4 [Syntrophorhabdus sp. PtaU1.Bin050]
MISFLFIGGTRLRIGFHVSTAKGFDWTLREAERLGCEVVQIFLKNPRAWAEKVLMDADLESFKRLSRSLPVFAHLSYLPNIAKIDVDERHMRGFLHEIDLCKRLGVHAMVVHCGSRPQRDEGIRAASQAINRALEEFDISIFLENSAGQGHWIGETIDELSAIYQGVKDRERVSLCLDTAHLFAAGYDIRAWEVWDCLIREVDSRFGPHKIGLFHLNDSKTDLGKRIDRHWHIGRGKIGLNAFRNIVNDLRLKNLMGVMETPKVDNMDEENIKIMRSLLSPLMSRSFS